MTLLRGEKHLTNANYCICCETRMPDSDCKNVTFINNGAAGSEF